MLVNEALPVPPWFNGALQFAHTPLAQFAHVVNFDVAALQHALADSRPGELGSYFATRPFNGVVWISTRYSTAENLGGGVGGHIAGEPARLFTWGRTMTNALVGFADLRRRMSHVMPSYQYPGLAPIPARSADPVTLDDWNRFLTGGPLVLRGMLPSSLCGLQEVFNVNGLSNALGAFDAGLHPVHPSSHTYDAGIGAAWTSFFYPQTTLNHPDMNQYQLLRNRYVRIINARNINRTAAGTAPAVPEGKLPRGLPIASDVGVIVVGDVNTSSTPAMSLAEVDDGHPWVPVLIAGDTVRVHNNNADDYTDAADTSRVAVTTTLNACFLTGVAVDKADNTSMPADTAMAVAIDDNADWSKAELNINGAIVAGYEPAHPGFPDLEPIYRHGPPSSHTISFDHHLSNIDDQPPGSTEIPIQSVRAWERH